MKHRLFLTLISAVLIISLNACSFSDNKDVKKQEDSSSDLTVLSRSDSRIEGVISKFRTLYPDIKIKDKRYFDNDEVGLKEKAITEIMAGEGPDILIIKAQDYPNIHKMLENDIFYNLDSLIKKDKSFKMDDYNKVAMDSGIYEGKRNFVPLYFNTPVLITTKTFLSDQGFSIPEVGVTWVELSKMTKKFLNNEKNKGKYLLSYDFSFEKLIQGSYMKYIDYSKRKSSFDSKEFIALLNICKELQPAVCPDEIAKKTNAAELLVKGTIGIMQDEKPIEVQSLNILSSIFKEYLGEDIHMIPFPCDQQKVDIAANIKVVAGINANCKKPKEAFDFLKLLLEKTNQTRYIRDSNYVQGSSINIEAWKEELSHFMSADLLREKTTGYDAGGSIDFTTSPLSSNTGAEMDRLYNGITKAEIYDYMVLSILSEETKEFLEGKSSAEKTAKAINDKVMLYLNE